jgi:hypothetical protein
MLGTHAVLAWLAAAAALATLAAAIAAIAGVRGSRLWLDRAILVLVVAVLGTSLVGLTLPPPGRMPSDPLHVLYGVVALVALPIARYAGRGSPRLTGRYTLVGSAFVIAVMLRLFMTG